MYFTAFYAAIWSSRRVPNKAKYMQPKARRSLHDRQHSIPSASLWGSTAIYVEPFLVRDVDIHILRLLSTMYSRASMVRLGEGTTLQPPAEPANGGRQTPAQMSMAFLVGDRSNTHCTGLKAVKDCFDMASSRTNMPPVHPGPWKLQFFVTNRTPTSLAWTLADTNSE
jgi:hypothetical protein